MKTYLFNLLPKIAKYSKKLDDLSLIKNINWVAIDSISGIKTVYIFGNENKLIISNSGVVEIGEWDYLNNESILLKTSKGSFLLKHGFIDESLLILKQDGTNQFAFFINETNHTSEFNSLESINQFISEKYLKGTPKIEGIYYFTDTKTLERMGPYSSSDLVRLKSKNVITSYTRIENRLDKKTYKLKDIVY